MSMTTPTASGSRDRHRARTSTRITEAEMRRMGQPYHVGIVVPRLEASMATLSAALGVEWSDVHVRGSAPSLVRVACSRGGAPHLELLEGPPDSLWASTG